MKVLAGLAVAVLAFITIAGLAYQSVADLSFALSEEARHKKKLIYLNEVMTDLASAESSVRTFTITHDAEYLVPYQEAVSLIEEKISLLHELTRNEMQKRRTDSFELMINKKYIVFNDLLNLREDDEVERILNEIIRNLEDREREAISDNEKSKISKLKELFRPQKAIKEKTAQELEEIKDEIVKLQREQQLKAEIIRQKEFDLTKLDAEIMSNIRRLMTEMEKYEAQNAKLREEKAASLSKRTTRVITIITVVTFILLLVMAYLILTYLTNAARLNEEMSEARDKAEKLAKAKEDFLATMSHEIRTPMNAILGFSEQLEKTKLDTRQKKYIDTIKNSTEYLLEVVNDILDHAKLESGRFSFEHVGFKPTEVVRTVVDSFRNMAQEKNLELSFNVEGAIPEVLIGDPYRLKQVLFNLIGNAIKFTEEGQVEVVVKALLKSPSSTILQIDVIDTGIGIAEEKIEKIFEGFYQSDLSTTRKYGGTGLGLAITKRLVELQKGKIEVHSEENNGTTFSVALSFQIGEEKDLEETISIPSDPSVFLGKLSVLVVDDEEYNRMLLDAILVRWGMLIISCENGHQAISELNKNHFDLILMDVRMPEFSGLDATRHIRKKMSGEKAEIPIIALTAASSEEDIKKCKGAGMNDFLSKPFRESELFSTICSVLKIDLSKSGFNKELNNGVSRNGNKTATELDFDLSELERLGQGDEDFVPEMLRVFIQNTTDGLKKINESAEANDWDKTGLLAHRLAAPCRHLGMKHIVKLLKEIENNAHNKLKLETIKPTIVQIESDLRPIMKSLEQKIAQKS